MHRRPLVCAGAGLSGVPTLRLGSEFVPSLSGCSRVPALLSVQIEGFTGTPFALMGGVLALWLRDIPWSISAESALSSCPAWRC